MEAGMDGQMDQVGGRDGVMGRLKNGWSGGLMDKWRDGFVR